MNNLDRYLFVLLICVISLFPLVIDINISDMVLSVRYLVLNILLLVFFIFSYSGGLKKHIFHSPIVKIQGVLILVLLISALVNGWSSDSFFALNRMFLLFSFFVLFSDILSKNNILLIAKSVLVFTSVLIIIYFLQIGLKITRNIDVFHSLEIISSTMGNKNLLASILFLCLPFLFYVFLFSTYYWKLISIIHAFLLVVVLLFVQSKAVFLGLIMMMLFLTIFNIKSSFKKVVFYLSFLVGVSLLFFYINPSLLNSIFREGEQLVRTKDRFLENRLVENDSRALLYIKTLTMIKDSPFLGVGPGNWRKEIPKYGLENTRGQNGDSFPQRPHSDFLWFFAEGGFFAGFLYISLFFMLLKECYFLFYSKLGKQRDFFVFLFSSFVGYFIISLFDFPCERPSHNLLMGLLGAIIISTRLESDSERIRFSPLVYLLFISLFLFNIMGAVFKYNGEKYMAQVLINKSNGKWDMMLNSLDKAYNNLFYDIDNTSTPLMWYYGIAYFNQGNLESAFNSFEEAYLINPNHLHVINNLATCYGFKEDYKKAIKLYQKCNSISPKFEEGALNLSALYLHSGENEKAFDVLLDVYNFNLENKSCLSQVYKQYVNRVFTSLSDENMDFLTNEYIIKKRCIFGHDQEDSDFYFNELKEISWMRKEKKMTYQQIFKEL